MGGILAVTGETGKEVGGRAISLSGRVGIRGRINEQWTYQFAALGGPVLVLPSNTDRVWSSLQFSSPVAFNTCFLSLSQQEPGGSGILLRHEDILVLDALHPWTGPVWAYLSGAGVSGDALWLVETSLAE